MRFRPCSESTCAANTARLVAFLVCRVFLAEFALSQAAGGETFDPAAEGFWFFACQFFSTLRPTTLPARSSSIHFWTSDYGDTVTVTHRDLTGTLPPNRAWMTDDLLANAALSSA
jgi:hypothetical protein